MDKQMSRRHRLWYGVAVLVLVLGCAAAAILIISTLQRYPTSITEAYRGPQKKIEVPGTVELELSREGAYGVYYEGYGGTNTQAEWPPRLDCSLTSNMTGKDIPLVPDYVVTNRYRTKDGRVGVLIYSTTVEDPGLHTFSCDYLDGWSGPKLILAIGPNYFFEFLRVAWNLSGSLLGGLGVLFGSFVLSLGIAMVALVRGSRLKRVPRKVHE
ncbi:MAG: hypothetical protein GTO18_15015 [Anaerolineales bacterium]|nr:hypothetical protein [Anaerolineales bacterium]